jgi:hypothetical protein
MNYIFDLRQRNHKKLTKNKKSHESQIIKKKQLYKNSEGMCSNHWSLGKASPNGLFDVHCKINLFSTAKLHRLKP